MRCDNCKKVIAQEHKTISFSLWGYYYTLCSVECAHEITKKIPELKNVVPLLSKDIEMKARVGNIEYGSCCDILESHHELMKDDPEHLPTEFIKEISQCSCKSSIRRKIRRDIPFFKSIGKL